MLNQINKVFNNIEHFQEVPSVWILLHILIPGNCMDQKVLDKYLLQFLKICRKKSMGFPISLFLLHQDNI